LFIRSPIFTLSLSLKVTKEPACILAFATYFITRFLNRETKSAVPLQVVAVIGGLMSFLIVFYLQQSYQRYIQQYSLSMGVNSRFFDLSLAIRNQLPPVAHWRLWRYLCAAQISAYTGLSHCYREENFFMPLNVKYQLVTEQELTRLQQIGLSNGGSACRELFSWCSDIIFSCVEDKQVVGNYEEILRLLFEVRRNMGALYDFADQPMPFPYIHFVNIMLAIYLPLHAYCVAMTIPQFLKGHPTSIEMVGPIVIFLNCLFNIGLTGTCL